MIVRCLYDTMLDVNSLKPHPKNRNTHSEEQIKRLAKILAYQGIRHPIKVSKRSGYITSGHGRLEAIKLNGWQSAPVNFQDYDDENQELADLTSDNAIAEWAELEVDDLALEFDDGFDLELLGLDVSLEPVKEPKAKTKKEKKKEPVVCPECLHEFEP